MTFKENKALYKLGLMFVPAAVLSGILYIMISFLDLYVMSIFFLDFVFVLFGIFGIEIIAGE